MSSEPSLLHNNEGVTCFLYATLRMYCSGYVRIWRLLFILTTVGMVVFDYIPTSPYVNSHGMMTTVKPAKHVHVDGVASMGQTELRQLRTYLANSTRVDATHASKTGHRVTVTSLEVTDLTVTVKLRDVRMLMPNDLRGGNSFRSIVRSAHYRYAAAYVDYSNDTYDVIFVLYDVCAHMTIHLTYVNYGAYRWDGVFINDVVFNATVCRTKLGTVCTTRPGLVCDNVAENSTEQPVWHYEGWYRERTDLPWRWLRPRRRELPRDEHIRQCVAALPKPIEYLGDSHIRYVVNSIQTIAEHLPEPPIHDKLQTNFSTDEFVYTFTGYSVNPESLPGFLADSRGLLPFLTYRRDLPWTHVHADLLTAGKQWAERERHRFGAHRLHQHTTSQRYLILSIGTWDLQHRNIRYFLSSSIPTLRTFFQTIEQDNILSKVNVIVTTVPAVREDVYVDWTRPGSLVHTNLRNHAMMAATMTLLADLVREFRGVSLVDWFTSTVSRSNETADSVHYTLPLQNQLNDVGMTLMRLLVDEMCTNYFTNKPYLHH